MNKTSVYAMTRKDCKFMKFGGKNTHLNQNKTNRNSVHPKKKNSVFRSLESVQHESKHTCAAARQTSESGMRGFRFSFRSSLGLMKIYSPLAEKPLLLRGSVAVCQESTRWQPCQSHRSVRRPAQREQLTANTFPKYCFAIQIPAVPKENNARKPSWKQPGVSTNRNAT